MSRKNPVCRVLLFNFFKLRLNQSVLFFFIGSLRTTTYSLSRIKPATHQHQHSPWARATNTSKLNRGRMKEDFVTLVGATSSDNCVNTRCSSATVSCHGSPLTIASSGGGFRSSALNTGSTHKESQVLLHLSAFEHSMVLVSTGGQVGASGFETCASSRNNSVTASCQTSVLSTQSSGGGLWLSAYSTGCIMKISQVP